MNDLPEAAELTSTMLRLQWRDGAEHLSLGLAVRAVGRRNRGDLRRPKGRRERLLAPRRLLPVGLLDPKVRSRLSCRSRWTAFEHLNPARQDEGLQPA